MASQDSETPVPLHIQQQIDACCLEFEDAWKAGKTAELEEFVTRVPEVGRARLLRELLILELNYRRASDGERLNDSLICALHPDLMPEIGNQLQQLRDQDGKPGSGIATKRPPSTHIAEPTIDHTPQRSGSRGLHIRCPHCSNPVELLADTPLQSITCRTCGSTFSLVDQDDHTREAPTLKRIGRFELVARVGIGGFGTVWKARDTELDRTVAVKIPRKGQLGKDEIEQFFREARSAAQLRHPNIVPVHEVGRDEETIFIVSDLIRGVSLSDWLSGATPSPREVADLLVIVCDALQHAHDQGVIHRDLKPSNILLDDYGRPHLMDFGLAKREIGEVTMTVEGHVLGTPAYMSPEQAAGEAHWTDRRTDIYSMGVVIFRMLTGELPFRGNAQMQIHQRLNADPPDPRTLNKHLPRDLCIICLKCLERDPNRRFNTAKELGEELQRFVRREPIKSRPVSRVEKVLRWASRNPWLATAAGLFAFLAIAGPITAIVVSGLYRREHQLRIENEKLIARSEKDITKYETQLTEANKQLKIWTGEANPFLWLWPPSAENPPRKKLIHDALKHSTATLTKPLCQGKYDPEQTAQGYLAMGMLSNAVGNTREAREYFQRAYESLTALREQHPDDPQFTRAAADCLMRLAEVTRPTDPDSAANEIEDARALYEQLTGQAGAGAFEQIGLLEAEMGAAATPPGEPRLEHLGRVATVHRQVVSSFSTTPDGLYQLACSLTGIDPVLAAPATTPQPEGSNADTANTKK